MKYCPICDRNYVDEEPTCVFDGANLIELGIKQDPYIGQVIKGRYQVAKKLGEGGMGTVYLAEQVSLGKRVALKVLHGEFARDEEFVRRFRLEARIAASLTHRNVITVYDFDQGDDGSLFIAMEHVDGKNLKEVLQEGPLEVGRAVRLGIQIAEGLGAAHRAGVIHRDIKPENIMVVQGKEVKLMDFGIARLKDTGTVGRLTRAGTIMGTPSYMSPEQIEGSEVSESTDIYAFGIVLYEMLSGDVPFKAPTPAAVLHKHLHESPVSLRRLRREIPASVEKVVMQALEKDPQKRQRNMEEIADGLRNAEGSLEVGLKGGLEGDLRNAQAASEERAVPKTWVGSRTVVEAERVIRHLGKRWKLAAVAAVVVLGTVGVIAGAMYIVNLGSDQVRDSPLPAAKTVSLQILADKRELRLGERTALRVRGQYSDGREEELTHEVEWLSSNPFVATVSPEGEVVGQKGGNADITARYAGIASPPLNVIVEREKPDVARPAPVLVSLTVIADKRDLKVKERATLRVKGRYSDGSEVEVLRGVEWQSSDKKIAAVDAKGRVMGRESGYADITARYEGKVSSPLTLIVKGTPPEPPPQPASRSAERKPAIEVVKPSQTDRERLNAFVKLADLYLEQGRYRDAIGELEKARAMDPANTDVQARLDRAKKAWEAEKRLGL